MAEDKRGFGDDDLLPLAVAAMERASKKSGFLVLLVGAYARELFLEGKTGSAVPRRTQDVDFAVRVNSWTEYVRLLDRLVQTGAFSRSEAAPQHKLLFHGRLEIDLVPFGGIVDEDGILTCWPEEFGQEMNLAGFQEAFENAEIVSVGACHIPAITVESFAFLKLFAWDNRPDREKDAQDLAYIFKEYANLPGKLDPLWEPANQDLQDLLPSFDRQCVRMLGRNVARAFRNAKTRTMACRILRRELAGPSFHLASQMRAHYALDSALEVLSDFLDGIEDAG